MGTYVWVYERREEGRPIGLRLTSYNLIRAGEHILSARFSSPEETATALGYYLEYSMDGHALINDARAGRPIGFAGRMRIAFSIAP